MTASNRRQFLVRSGMAGLAAKTAGSIALMSALNGRAATETSEEGSSSAAKTLYNTNIRTVIGLGDEPTGIVDKYGQLRRSWHTAFTRLQFGSPLQPAENAEWSQWLLDNHIPIVNTELKKCGASIRLSAFTSDYGQIKADYLEIQEASNPYRVELLFPFATSLEVREGTVTSLGNVLAVFPPPKKVSVTLAKYNLLTPESWSSLSPPFSEYVPVQLPPGTDDAFATSRGIYLNRGIEYRFPAQAGKTYHVFLGLFPEKQVPGEILLKLSVGDKSQYVDYGVVPPGRPLLREFAVTPHDDEIRVRSESDSSEAGWIRGSEVSGIWIFDAPVEAGAVVSGRLNSRALYYVKCGREPVHDLASSVVLDYEPAATGESRWIRLPYGGAENAAQVRAIAPGSARQAEIERWTSLLGKASEFTTGVSHLDDLYRTCLVNLFLLRTKYPGQGKDGQDIYVVKPGPDLYDTFWTRDGAQMINAFDLAGLPDEAEKSLRLLWHPNLTGTLASWGQQLNGAWTSPIWQWDGQGQALWALVNHYELTRDREWLKNVYANIRKGTEWIKQTTEQTQFVSEHGEKPIYYGLLPPGEGESIATGFVYYHCFWAIFGVRQALRAAQALNQSADIEWMKKLDEEFSANLLASVKLACQRIGDNKFIPGTPFDPSLSIWGSMSALWPSRFLDPHDPMITGSLAKDETVLREDTTDGYMTLHNAMCHLLRDELPMFHRLYNGYVAHVSPTNGWVEDFFFRNREGSGDMPHGWGAALYITAHRSSFVYENERKLELCWGVQPAWLHDRAQIAAKRAPTRFGTVDFTLKRAGHELNLDYSLTASPDHEVAEETRLHIPDLNGEITSVRVNGRVRALTAGDSVITL